MSSLVNCCCKKAHIFTDKSELTNDGLHKLGVIIDIEQIPSTEGIGQRLFIGPKVVVNLRTHSNFTAPLKTPACFSTSLILASTC